MPIRLTVTVLTVDNHDQEEFLHLVHEVAVAIRWLADNADVTDDERARVRDWLQALRNHAVEDLKNRPDALELIRQAIEALFDVSVISVHTMSVKSKPKRRGQIHGRTRQWKKAIVHVSEGDSIPIFQGLESLED